MTRHPTLILGFTLLAMAAVAAAAAAAPLRSASVGDRMGSLVAGLVKVDAGPVGSCTGRGPVIHSVHYLVPGRPADDDNASLIGFSVGDRVVILVAFDEDDLSTPLAVIYADRNGKGLITDVWSAEDAPTLCEIVGAVHDQP
jgi:hypothetical protein